MAAAEKFKVFNKTKEYIGDGTIDLDAGDAYFVWALLSSAYTEDLTDSTWSDVSANEVTSNGAGQLVASGVTWTESSGTVTFDASTDPVWTASGGSIVARRLVLVHRAAGSGVLQATDKLIALNLMDSAPADITVTAGDNLLVTLNASGVFTVSGGTAA